MKEIHSSLLRKHLERLEPLESERDYEEDNEPTFDNDEEKVPLEEGI